MMEHHTFIDHIRKRFPCPTIRPEWVRDCIQALRDEGHPVTPDTVLEEFTYSDLGLSALPSLPLTLPSTTVLFPKPTLLQITFLTEIASSAVQLQNTMEQRRDVLSGVTRIRGLEDEGEEEEDLGKLPAYPRGMMKLHLGDGVNVLTAIEYRRIEELMLGNTKLGCKVLLHDVKASRGILLLTPENATVVGGEVPELEQHQPARFIASLKDRIEAAKLPPPALPPRRALPRPAAKTRAPKRAKVEPATNAGPSSGLRTGGTNGGGRAGRRSMPISVDDTDDDDPVVRAREARRAAILGSTTSPCFGRTGRVSSSHNFLHVRENEDDEFDISDDPDESFLRHVDNAERAAVARTSHSGSHAGVQAQYEDEDYEDDVWADDSFLRHVDEAEAEAAASGERRNGGSGNGATYDEVIDDDDDEYGLDDGFLDNLDAHGVEEYDDLVVVGSQQYRSSGRTGGGVRGSSGRTAPIEVIEISD